MKQKMIILFVTLMLVGVLTGCENKDHTEKIATGMKLIEELNYTEANEFFGSVLLEDENKEAYRGQGIAYIGLGEYENAIVSFENALRCTDGAIAEIDYDINYYLAVAYYKNGQYVNAKEVYSAILDLKEKDKDALLLRGKCSLQLGQLDEATDDFDKYLALDSKNVTHYIDIYKSMDELDFGEQGNVYLNKALTEISNLSSEEEGMIRFYLGEYERAKELLEAGSHERTEETALILGKTYEALGAETYAASVYLNYIESDPTSAEIYNQLAMCKLKEGNYDEALTYIAEGFAYADVELLQVMRFNEVVIYEYAGQFSNAKKSMEAYLSDYPGDEVAILEYEFLKSR